MIFLKKNKYSETILVTPILNSLSLHPTSYPRIAHSFDLVPENWQHPSKAFCTDSSPVWTHRYPVCECRFYFLQELWRSTGSEHRQAWWPRSGTYPGYSLQGEPEYLARSAPEYKSTHRPMHSFVQTKIIEGGLVSFLSLAVVHNWIEYFGSLPANWCECENGNGFGEKKLTKQGTRIIGKKVRENCENRLDT